MVLFGSMGLLDKIVVLGCIPVGAMGMARLTRPLGTAWARVTSTVIYLAIPVPYDALATAHWDAMVVYAACPWIVHLLGQASRVGPLPRRPRRPPRRVRPPRRARRGMRVLGAAPAEPAAVPGAPRALHRAAPRAPRVAPIAPRLQPRAGLAGRLRHVGGTAGRARAPGGGAGPRARQRGVAGLGRAASRRPGGGHRASGATVVAVLLLAPWSFAVLGGPARWQTLAGVPVALVLGRGVGRAVAVGRRSHRGRRARVGVPGRRGTAAGHRGPVAAWPGRVGRGRSPWWRGRSPGWRGGVASGPLAIAPQVLLVPAGVGIALAIGLGVAAFQLDLPGYRFGWRQAAAVTAAAAAVVGMLPVLVGSLGGRWDLVPSGYGEATTWMSANKAQGDFRVLWLGDPRVLPGNGWELAPGLAYTVSENGLPDMTGLWPGSSPGKAAAIGNGIRLARSHATVRLGRLLAPYAVRYVVVVDTLAPVDPRAPDARCRIRPPVTSLGALSSADRPPPGDLPGRVRRVSSIRSSLPLRAIRTRARAPRAAVTGVGGHRGRSPS